MDGAQEMRIVKTINNNSLQLKRIAESIEAMMPVFVEILGVLQSIRRKDERWANE